MIVVGAGAAGTFAAWRAASLGARVTLLEKTGRVGTKILVSGGGKCNIAHAGPIEQLLSSFRPEEARFLRPACYRLRNDQIVELFTSRGLRVYTRPDGRIFPVDQTAKDVVAIIRGYLEEAGVQLLLDSPATGLVLREGSVEGVTVGRAFATGARRGESGGYRSNSATNLLREFETVAVDSEAAETVLSADAVVLCCGGSSYPNSGTTGDGWAWARQVGHTIVKLRAALAPLYLESVPDLSGVSLQGVRLRARQGKEIAGRTGDLLFTHQGLSGPCALGVSRIVAEKMEAGKVELEIDLMPDRSFEGLSEELLAYCGAFPSRQITGFLEAAMPSRILTLTLEAAKVAPETTGSRLDRKARNRLATVLKGWPLGPVRHVPLEKGEVVAGGVSLSEVDPHSMRSKLARNLYLCGEILDVAGPVGGYNLQAAFATGFVAGESAARG